MKKKLLYFLLFIGVINSNQAQVSMIGTALSSELDMAQFSLYTFQQQATFTTGNIKFRQSHSWDVNWGNSSFPSGTGVQNGPDIPVTAGTYIVSFNTSSGAYSFEPTTPTPIISIVGTGVNGWPENQTTPEITLSTIDNINYSISNLTVSTGEVKFRQDYSWTNNWGGNTFPNGQGILNSANNIQTVAGVYNVTFNIQNATYTFIPTTIFPSIGIWGPAVDSQNGYAGPDIDMTTTDGITYTLSGFYFSSGQAYFRQDNATNSVWGSTSFPTGTAVLSGPSLFIPGGEYFVTFNRTTGAYSFATPSIGILGTAINGYEVSDTDMNTTDGFTYTLTNFPLTNGTVKFRKDNLWTSNWGSASFPFGTGVQDGANIPVTAGNYNISFDKSSGAYSFQNTLTTTKFESQDCKVFPNPTSNNWNFIASYENIKNIKIYDILGKTILEKEALSKEINIDCTSFEAGVYFAKIDFETTTITLKLIKQ